MKAIFVLLLLYSSTNKLKKEHSYLTVFQTDTASVLMDKFFDLKEVVRCQTHLRRLKGKNASVAIYISSKPSKADPYYYLQVGYDGPFRFEGYDNYRVNKKDIFKKDFYKYVEIANIEGQFIPILKWRQHH